MRCENNEKLIALEEKFDRDNDEQAFVDGVLDVIANEDFADDVVNDNITCDSMCFSWKIKYDRNDEPYETYDLTSEPFAFDDVSEENTKIINDAICDAIGCYVEGCRIQQEMRDHPSWYISDAI